MIFGAHVIVYSKDATADRAFLRDILGFASVDAGHGWLIFALPPAELAVHPAEKDSDDAHQAMIGAHLYLMCDDVRAMVASLKARSVECSQIDEAPWGLRTTIELPSGGPVGPD